MQGRRDIISLGVGEPDFVTPWHIRESAIYALERGHTSYTSNLGLPKLRAAISDYVAGGFGVSYDPETQILVSVGVSEALDIALRAIINPGDEIIYHEPCYVSYAPGIVLAHGVPVAVPCLAKDGFAVTAEAIERAITPKSKALVLNFPTNPTGGTMTRESLEAIARLAKHHNLLVITDEIYAELTFEGKHTSIAALPGMAERTIFLHGFSKAYAMTGFRIGYACGPAELIEAMMRIHQYSMLCASIISQEAAIEALQNGAEPVAEMKEQYRLRRNYIVKAFNDMGLDCHLPRGSFYAFPSVQSTGLGSGEFASRLVKEKNVACVPGNAFGDAGEGFLRCCFATGLEQIKDRLRTNRSLRQVAKNRRRVMRLAAYLISSSSTSNTSVAIRRNHSTGAACAVRQIGRNIENRLATLFHQLQSLGPAGDHAVEREGRRLAALDGAVEHFAADQLAGVVHGHLVCGFRVGTGSGCQHLVGQTGSGGLHSLLLFDLGKKRLALDFVFVLRRLDGSSQRSKLRLVTLEGVGLFPNPLDTDLVDLVALGDGVDNILPLNDMAKDGVFAIKMRRSLVGYEKLATVGAWT